MQVKERVIHYHTVAVTKGRPRRARQGQQASILLLKCCSTIRWLLVRILLCVGVYNGLGYAMV